MNCIKKEYYSFKNKFKSSKPGFFIEKCLVPTKQSGPLAKYQKIISFGIRVSIICLVLSFLFFFYEEKVLFFSLLKDLFVGIFCSMIVVIMTSILQFQKTREEMFEVFYDKVFILTGQYKALMDLNGHIDVERAKECYVEMKDIKNIYDGVSFKFYWFSREKLNEYSIVVSNVEIIFLNLKNIVEKGGRGIEGFKNKESVSNIVNEMKKLSETYYEDKYNLFKKDFWR